MAATTITHHDFFTRSGRYRSTGTDRKDERVQLLSLRALSL
ncbi:hypothetical protein [Streptomyces sp. NPDC060022]